MKSESKFSGFLFLAFLIVNKFVNSYRIRLEVSKNGTDVRFSMLSSYIFHIITQGKNKPFCL